MLVVARIVLWLNVIVGAIGMVDAFLSRPGPGPLAVMVGSVILTLSVGFLGVIAAIERARQERAALAAAEAAELARIRDAIERQKAP